MSAAAGSAGELAVVALSARAALAGGVGALRGEGSGRWLLVAWMAAPIVLSLFHSPVEVRVHAVLFTGVLALLFLPPSAGPARPGPHFAPRPCALGGLPGGLRGPQDLGPDAPGA